MGSIWRPDTCSGFEQNQGCALESRDQVAPPMLSDLVGFVHVCSAHAGLADDAARLIAVTRENTERSAIRRIMLELFSTLRSADLNGEFIQEPTITYDDATRVGGARVLHITHPGLRQPDKAALRSRLNLDIGVGRAVVD